MILKRIVAAAVLMICAAPAQAQGVRKLDVSFSDGRVTIVAENVTLAEVLAEWSRKGGTRIVNAEKLAGGPLLPTEFTNQPEAEVLRALLREAPGYGARMRTAPSDADSIVGAVFILAVRSVAVSNSAPPVTNQQQGPASAAPSAAPRMIQGSPDDEIPPVRPIGGDQPPMTPGGQPATDPSLRVGPGGTVTSTRPGVIIPVQNGPPGASGPGPTPQTPPGGRGRGGGGGGR